MREIDIGWSFKDYMGRGVRNYVAPIRQPGEVSMCQILVGHDMWRVDQIKSQWRWTGLYIFHGFSL